MWIQDSISIPWLFNIWVTDFSSPVSLPSCSDTRNKPKAWNLQRLCTWHSFHFTLQKPQKLQRKRSWRIQIKIQRVWWKWWRALEGKTTWLFSLPPSSQVTWQIKRIKRKLLVKLVSLNSGIEENGRRVAPENIWILLSPLSIIGCYNLNEIGGSLIHSLIQLIGIPLIFLSINWFLQSSILVLVKCSPNKVIHLIAD